MKRILLMTSLCLIVAVSFASTKSTRESGEAKAQSRLPQAKDSLWLVLRQTQINVDEDQGLYTATHPATVKKLDGTVVTIRGFMLPLSPSAKVKRFLLTKYTPVCFFCPPGEPNEVIDVTTTSPVVWSDGIVKVTGKFRLINNGEQGLFFQMSQASVVEK